MQIQDWTAIIGTIVGVSGIAFAWMAHQRGRSDEMPIIQYRIAHAYDDVYALTLTFFAAKSPVTYCRIKIKGGKIAPDSGEYDTWTSSVTYKPVHSWRSVLEESIIVPAEAAGARPPQFSCMLRKTSVRNARISLVSQRRCSVVIIEATPRKTIENG